MNEENTIINCIESIESLDYDRDKFELIFIDGGSEDDTIDIINHYIHIYDNIKLIIKKGANTSVARNIGIKNAKGNIIINFSGHAYVENNYLKVISKKIANSEENMAGIGCKDAIPNKKNSIISKGISSIFKTKLGGSMMHQNLTFKKDTFVDSISFTAYKKNIFNIVGGFHPEFPQGDDAEFNIRVKKAGYKLLFTPDTIVYRYRRNTIKSFVIQIFRYGKMRMQIMKIHPESIKLRYLIPIGFINFLLIYLFMYIFKVELLLNILNYIFYIYFSLVFFYAIKIFMNEKEFKLLLICTLLFFLEHISYGAGLFISLFQYKSFNKNNVIKPRFE